MAYDRARSGYRAAGSGERSAFGMLGGISSSLAIARAINYARERNRRAPRTRGLLRRVAKGPRDHQPRVHHFVPGIGIAYSVAVAAISARSDRREAWLAPAFGVGVGLTLDELALLVDLDNAYWASERAAIVTAGAAGLGTLALLGDFVRRGRTDPDAPRMPQPTPIDDPVPAPAG
jgi:hypothetical protein